MFAQIVVQVLPFNRDAMKTKIEKLHQERYNRKNRLANRALMDAEKDQACADCREIYPPWVMDFDHVTAKKANVSSMLHASREKVKAEIAKCEVVCANCHRMRTYLRRKEKTNATKS